MTHCYECCYLYRDFQLITLSLKSILTFCKQAEINFSDEFSHRLYVKKDEKKIKYDHVLEEKQFFFLALHFVPNVQSAFYSKDMLSKKNITFCSMLLTHIFPGSKFS